MKNSTNPYNLKAFLHLLKNFRIYAPDTIGHPGRSAQTVLSSRDNSYGEWAADVIGGIGLERAGAIGISYGGGNNIIRLPVCHYRCYPDPDNCIGIEFFGIFYHPLESLLTCIRQKPDAPQENHSCRLILLL